MRFFLLDLRDGGDEEGRYVVDLFGKTAEGLVTNLLVWLAVDCRDAKAGDV